MGSHNYIVHVMFHCMIIVFFIKDNVTWTCASAAETYNFKEGEEVMISYLPVSHIVAQV